MCWWKVRIINMKTIIEEIVRERAKQIVKWGNSSDDLQTLDQLVKAASSYLLNSPLLWPEGEAWNPANFKTIEMVGRRGQLIRAATLIVAEIERIDRLQQ